MSDSKCVPSEKPAERKKCFEKACVVKAEIVQMDAGNRNALVNIRWLTGLWSEVRSFAHFFGFIFYCTAEEKTPIYHKSPKISSFLHTPLWVYTKETVDGIKMISDVAAT